MLKFILVRKCIAQWKSLPQQFSSVNGNVIEIFWAVLYMILFESFSYKTILSIFFFLKKCITKTDLQLQNKKKKCRHNPLQTSGRIEIATTSLVQIFNSYSFKSRVTNIAQFDLSKLLYITSKF